MSTSACHHLWLNNMFDLFLCSVSLQSNSIWTNTIGVEKEGGGNSVVEASLNAPQFGGGRAARRAAAAEVVAQTGTVQFKTSIGTLTENSAGIKHVWDSCRWL